MHIGPLIFQEVYKPKPWGGRALKRVARKPIPPDEPIGESWEISDHPHGPSEVKEGPLEGRRLRELMRHHGEKILGRPADGQRFPLLIKIIDASERLSVQVHPDDATARALKLNDTGKTEAWVVLESRRDGCIISGLKSYRVADRLRELVEEEKLGRRLARIRPKEGEVWFCPAGTVHALGPGVVLLEIQQNSDATLRLYDWGRVGLDGKPRPLHIDESIRAIGGRATRLRPGKPRRLRSLPFPGERLLRCDKFIMDRWRVGKRTWHGYRDGFEILHVVKGAGELKDPRWPAVRLQKGATVLIPACVEYYELLPKKPLTLIRAIEPR